jgi:hypothetical protein
VRVAGGTPIEPLDATFHGRRALRLEGASAWVEVLASGGPRIVGLGRSRGANVLAETPDLGWNTQHGRYELLGGHRLWFAPEDPERVAIPDRDGLAVERLADGLRLVGAVEPGTGLVRTIEVCVDPDLPVLEVRHELRNAGAGPLELAPWSITQVPFGGRVLLPQAPAVPGHAVWPTRTVVLWPYTSWEDPRLRIRDDLVTVEGIAGDELKVGLFDDAGWVAYVRDGTALVRRFVPAPGEPHTDLGCNVETYSDTRILELEVLGPLRTLAPGETAVLDERWELRNVDPDAGAGDDEAVGELARTLARPLGQAEPDTT